MAPHAVLLLAAAALPLAAALAAPAAPLKWLLDAALQSPLYSLVLVPQAKRTMVETAEQNGVAWRDSLAWIKEQGPWDVPPSPAAVPEYYVEPFHAYVPLHCCRFTATALLLLLRPLATYLSSSLRYADGNLNWDAAWEGEIASRAVGARNFPAFGSAGEDAFRGAFDDALADLGAACPDGGRIVDLGCGSGVSTRRLAEQWPKARAVDGIDLSPYFVAVGRRLLELAPGSDDGAAGGCENPWVNRIDNDGRVSLSVADAAETGLADECANVVVVSLVVHELPPDATRALLREALRLLKPSGQLWLTEMDFETPAFRKLRSNPVLFSLIRSTEPYLDVCVTALHTTVLLLLSAASAVTGLPHTTGTIELNPAAANFRRLTPPLPLLDTPTTSRGSRRTWPPPASLPSASQRRPAGTSPWWRPSAAGATVGKSRSSTTGEWRRPRATPT